MARSKTHEETVTSTNSHAQGAPARNLSLEDGITFSEKIQRPCRNVLSELAI